jgi:hypothetical protein
VATTWISPQHRATLTTMHQLTLLLVLVVPTTVLVLPTTVYATTPAGQPRTTGDAGRAFERLQQLCDGIGHRLSGSEGLAQAVRWALTTLAADGHTNVHAEPVTVPHWVRGAESLELLAPRPLKLHMLGLGDSVGTPPAGLEAELLVVRDEHELAQRKAEARGRIVLFNNPMPAWTAEHGSHYGETVRFRSRGPDMASALGAVAVLVRSVTATSLASPHTGATHYDGAVPKIPAAAVSVEHAGLLARLSLQGPVRLRLTMAAHFQAPARSANVIAELRGRDRPDEVVVIGGHLDSWDVGQGAHDDGAGVVHAIEALRLLRSREQAPRRTVRVVLWTNEENGLEGAKAYARAHAHDRHVAAIESDGGGFEPVGLGCGATDTASLAWTRALLDRIDPKLKLVPGHAGADTGPLRALGVRDFELVVHGQRYFDYHHSEGDTLDKVDPGELQRGAAVLAAIAWWMAELGAPP